MDKENLGGEKAIIEERRKKLEQLRDKGSAYGNSFKPKNNAKSLSEKYGDLSKEDLVEKNIKNISIAGRIVLKRVMGNASFATLRDSSGDIQIYVTKNNVDESVYEDFKTWDLGDIVGVSASNTSGYNSALANLGKVSNKGIELLLKVKPIVTDDFAMELSLNYTNNDSEVVATNDTDGMVSLDEPRGVAGNRNMRVMHIVGERYGALFGTSFKRDANGHIVHENSAGYPQPVIDNNRKILGFGVAPEQIGIGASFRYKDWNASLLVEGKTGGQIMSGSNGEMLGRGLHKMTVPAGGRHAGWTPEGVMEDGSAVSQSLTVAQQQNYWNKYNDAAEASIYDADYMRLRNISIGYNLPSSMLEGTAIQAASISLIGKNLFFLSNSVDNIDPESAYNSNNSQGLEYWGMPVPRTVGVNVNLKF